MGKNIFFEEESVGLNVLKMIKICTGIGDKQKVNR